MLDSVIGHAGVKAQLASAWGQRRLAQAYLLAGPHGVGKRTTALALAQLLLCESPKDGPSACGVCPACQQVLAETHPQFHVLRTPADKSELPVELVRAFTARLYQTPARVPRTVGLILDADDLNASSANSLLKTLEEPPAGAYLLLRTADAERQLPTIRSRAQLLRFAPLTENEVAEVLRRSGTPGPQATELAALAQGLPGMAEEFAGESFADFRAVLMRQFLHPDPVATAQAWVAFAEEAGKETRDQRRRAAASVRFAITLLQQAHRLTADPDAATPAVFDRSQLESIADRAPDAVPDWIDALAEAEGHLERNVQIALVIEQLAARLSCFP